MLLKLEEIITKEPIMKSNHPEIKAPKVSYRENRSSGRQFSFDWMLVTEPFVMRNDPHSHDFDEYLCFFSSNPRDMNDFQAEIELSLGEEREKHIITELTIVYIPKGLMHCPFAFKRIDKPVSYYNIFLASGNN